MALRRISALHLQIALSSSTVSSSIQLPHNNKQNVGSSSSSSKATFPQLSVLALVSRICICIYNDFHGANQEAVLLTVHHRLKGKVAIITGAASGIGEATAHLFANHGAQVVLADVQDELGRAVAASIGPGRATYVPCDVRYEDQIRHLVQTAVSAHGRVDVAFANAGIKHRGQAALDLDLSAMDGLFAVNVRGAAGLVKHAGRAMVEKGVEGSIICTASAASVVGGTSADYTMSKHAVLGLVRSACHDLGKHGIRVNCVSPYAVATPLLRGMYEEGVEELESRYSRRTSLQGRVLKVRHVADAALFLASDDSAFVSGHNLVVDGGFVSVRF